MMDRIICEIISHFDKLDQTNGNFQIRKSDNIQTLFTNTKCQNSNSQNRKESKKLKMNFFEGEHAHGSPGTSGSASHGAGDSAARSAASALAVLGAAGGSVQSREKKEKMMVRKFNFTGDYRW